MKRVQFVVYTAHEDVDEDVNRCVSDIRMHMDPELVIVGTTEVTEEALAAAVAEGDDQAL